MPKIFCELLTVADESWQDCVEACLGDRRFDILVPPAHYAAANECLSWRVGGPGRGSRLVRPSSSDGTRYPDRYHRRTGPGTRYRTYGTGTGTRTPYPGPRYPVPGTVPGSRYPVPGTDPVTGPGTRVPGTRVPGPGTGNPVPVPVTVPVP